MAKSIMPFNRAGRCYLCGRIGSTEEHHIFEGSGRRKLSELYGLKCNLDHWCHNEPPDGVHFNKEKDLELKARAQKVAMNYYGWTVDDFRRLFRKSYL